MQRVKTASAVQVRPAYSEDGTPGYFRNGDAVAAIPATVPGQDFFNMIQEEIVNVILAAGLTLSATNDAQLSQAIFALIAAQAVTVSPASTTGQGIVELATDAETIAGTDAERVVTPHALAAALLAGLSGVARLGAVGAYTRQQYPMRVARTGQSGNQAVDCDLHQALYITATGAITMQTPTNVVAEKEVRLRLYSASAQTISWASGWAGTSYVALPTATIAGKWMHLVFVADDDGVMGLVGYSVRA